MDLYSFNHDIVVRFASYLQSKDIVSLSLTCRRFGIAQQEHEEGLDNNRLSLMEYAARYIVNNYKTDEERNVLPITTEQQSSWIQLYSELEQYRSPRKFNQLIGRAISDPICFINNDRSRIKLLGNKKKSNTAICNHVMRAGKHYATFTKEGLGAIRIGIIRPLNSNWDDRGLTSFDPLSNINYWTELQEERTDKWGESNIHYCSVMFGEGVGGCHYSDWVTEHPLFNEWDGSEGFENNDKVGLLLDLDDAGTLTVYKNGRRLGILKDGLSGEYCWVAVMWTHGVGVKIDKGCIPTR